MVSIIIINYDTFQITCDCIESVLRFTKAIPYEIIVVDNASPNDDPDQFLARFPTVKLVKSSVNGGFAKGNNLGIAHSSGDIILLLNSDTLLTEDSVSIAANYLSAHTDIAALTVRLTYTDGRLQHTARKFRSITNEVLDLFRPLLVALPYKRRSQIMLNQYFHGDYNTYCDWVSGAFMMFTKSVLDKFPAGKLDERFFMYGEDQLWCYQFQKLGYRSFYLSETTVIHIHQASTAPAKQLQLLKKFLPLEFYLYELMNGRSLSYHVFKAILTCKEMMRYYIKIVVYRVFKRRIR